MKCAYCLEEMNDGATVCKVCAREQPPSKEEVARRKDNRAFIAAMVALGLIVGVPIAWFIAESWGREVTVNKIVDCLHSKGDAGATASFVKLEIDEAMTQTGKGWRASLPMAAMGVAARGQPAFAICYVRPDNIISEMKGD